MGKMVRAGAGIFDKLEPKPELEPDKNGPAPQHCCYGKVFFPISYCISRNRNLKKLMFFKIEPRALKRIYL
jgi:hypothetical protein